MQIRLHKKIRFLAIPALIFLTASLRSQESSRHFTVETLGDGVYAAIARNGGYAVCNSGIIDLGDATVVIDPFISPIAARDLKHIAEQLTGNPVQYVVNTHGHNDHVGGNQVFENAVFIGTSKMKDYMAATLDAQYRGYKQEAEAELTSLFKEDTLHMSPFEREEHRLWQGYYEAELHASGEIKPILPTRTFTDTLVLEGKKRKAILVSMGSLHTQSDLIVMIPDQKVAFLGDILFINYQPYLGDGNPEKLKEEMDILAAYDWIRVVPGHGSVGTPADFPVQKRYIQMVSDAAKLAVQSGLAPEEINRLKPEPPFNTWYLSGFYSLNVGYYYRIFRNNPRL